MSLNIIKAGLLDTIQDCGRNGYRHLGINPSGAMDRFSAQLSNALLGKCLDAPVIEMHFPASVYLFQKPTMACICGADFSATVNNHSIPPCQPFLAPENSVLQFTNLVYGARCYLSLLHDLDVEEWLQSASTNLKAVAGGWKGRKLITGDCIPFKNDNALSSLSRLEKVTLLHWKAAAPKAEEPIACIPGKEWDWLTAQAKERFLNTAFKLSNLSDRMGYRLYGAALTAQLKEELVSSAVDFGTIQLLPNGQLIILMADHQTTGGYPRLANVCSTSLSSLAQVKPHDSIQFCFTSMPEAEDILIRQKKYLEQLRNACKLKIETRLHASM